MSVKSLVRASRGLPLRSVARKAGPFFARQLARQTRAATETVFGSRAAIAGQWHRRARISVQVSDIPQELLPDLRMLSEHYLAHEFDLLGSGWVSPRYRFQAPGFLERRFESTAPTAPAKDGAGLEAVVNRANVARSKAAWRRISGTYQPIDWQLDFRSGYRWSARRHSYWLEIPVDAGADVKVPWELGRLQHLPQIAICAVLAKQGASGFRSPEEYCREIADQLLDFVAANPPRFGVQWMASMDVAIRAANIVLTRALLAGAGLGLAQADDDIVLSALREHGRHIVEHLDYADAKRSNHYLANLAGLLWIGWALEEDDESRRWVAFAIAALSAEVSVQFLADGGNYECSTGYHRLSAEMATFAIALVLSLNSEELAQIEQASPPVRAWRAGFPALPFDRQSALPGGIGIVSQEILATLSKAGRLMRAVQGDDGTIVQVGDVDSGRFFKLHPTALPAALSGPAAGFVENTLDHRGTADAIDALFSAPAASSRMDAVVIQKLVSEAGAIARPAPGPELPDHGDLDALIARWQSVPEGSRRLRRLPIKPEVDRWTRAAFPDLGLYLFRNDGGLLVAFRCLGGLARGAPSGHTHDDNLGIEYRLGEVQFRDPGSFVYTPDLAMRNRYRSAAAHDVPRIEGSSVAAPTSNPFELDHQAFARCLAWRPDGMAGEIAAPSGRILRIVKVDREALTIWDCVDPPARLSEIGRSLPPSMGYGRA